MLINTDFKPDIGLRRTSVNTSLINTAQGCNQGKNWVHPCQYGEQNLRIMIRIGLRYRIVASSNARY